jgi:hypothetical protein
VFQQIPTAERCWLIDRRARSLRGRWMSRRTTGLLPSLLACVLIACSSAARAAPPAPQPTVPLLNIPQPASSPLTSPLPTATSTSRVGQSSPAAAAKPDRVDIDLGDNFFSPRSVMVRRSVEPGELAASPAGPWTSKDRLLAAASHLVIGGGRVQTTVPVCPIFETLSASDSRGEDVQMIWVTRRPPQVARDNARLAAELLGYAALWAWCQHQSGR